MITYEILFTKMSKSLGSLCGCGSGQKVAADDENRNDDNVTSDEDTAYKGATGVAATKVHVSE